jgi:hypothetical protein
MEHIALDSIARYLALQIKAAAVATARQIINVHTGEGVVNTIWHTYAIIEQRTPWAPPAMRQARQQNQIIGFRIVNLIDWPLALLSIILLPLIAAGGRGRVPPDLQRLAAILSIAILANAVICGVLSNPHDRYGARLAWVPVLVIVIAALLLRETRDTD